ncbi:exosortase K [Xanthovirga aplysinae]|uniref:exosortase K n=1 Tax=Xanthovirga aplysinae TaxID=2529853 RepID=UPI0012BB8E25|nr:exosortase K [Xanthovirga aplysinae]MTI32397.1 exosortase K [Xanthovirga aplysinae]
MENLSLNIKTSQNAPYYLCVLLLVVVFKFYFRHADNDAFLFLLQPTNHIISFIMGSPSIYSNDRGFFHEQLNMVIDKSCSGFTFWNLCYTLILFNLLNNIRTNRKKLVLFPLALLAGYALTVFVNASRILLLLFLQRYIDISLGWVHEALGSFIYLSFLIFLYLSLEYSKTIKSH